MSDYTVRFRVTDASPSARSLYRLLRHRGIGRTEANWFVMGAVWARGDGRITVEAVS